PLGRLLLEQACRQAVAWRQSGHDLLLSVNLSPLQLSEPTLVADVADILHRTGLPAGRLQLEITESAVPDDRHGTLEGLAALGVGLSIDAFGPGSSSPAALPRLPIPGAKLAAEFLPAPAEVLRHTVALCHAAGLTVTAEGIETAGQEALLRDLKCDIG